MNKPKFTIERNGKTIEIMYDEAMSIYSKMENYLNMSDAEDVLEYEFYRFFKGIDIPEEVKLNAINNYVSNYNENRMDAEYAIAYAIRDAFDNAGIELPEEWLNANKYYL